jgi:hypothetical protein
MEKTKKTKTLVQICARLCACREGANGDAWFLCFPIGPRIQPNCSVATAPYLNILVREKKESDPTSMLVRDPIIGMNLKNWRSHEGWVTLAKKKLGCTISDGTFYTTYIF